MGEGLKGKDKRILPLLYCLAVYGATEEEMVSENLDKADIDVVKKASLVFNEEWTINNYKHIYLGT